ncbi:hypothetical protein [Vibrio owensii]|uniref:hypothetical protein n=1 Tax=Vibrio owensii TaxID=696485 RepID=UPI0018F12B17|nr:hypothetical protein [Vibrio owensii]
MECNVIEQNVTLKMGKLEFACDLAKAIALGDELSERLEYSIDALSSDTLVKSVLTHSVESVIWKTFEVVAGVDAYNQSSAIEYIHWAIRNGNSGVADAVMARAVACIYERTEDGVVTEPELNQDSIIAYHQNFRDCLSEFDDGDQLYLSTAWLYKQRCAGDYVTAAMSVWGDLFSPKQRMSVADKLGLDLCDVSVRHIVLLLSSVLGESAFRALTGGRDTHDSKDLQLRTI